MKFILAILALISTPAWSMPQSTDSVGGTALNATAGSAAPMWIMGDGTGGGKMMAFSGTIFEGSFVMLVKSVGTSIQLNSLAVLQSGTTYITNQAGTKVEIAAAVTSIGAGGNISGTPISVSLANGATVVLDADTLAYELNVSGADTSTDYAIVATSGIVEAFKASGVGFVRQDRPMFDDNLRLPRTSVTLFCAVGGAGGPLTLVIRKIRRAF